MRRSAETPLRECSSFRLRLLYFPLFVYFPPPLCLSYPVHYRETFADLLTGAAPILALAPMQDVTDLPFMNLMAGYGGPDVYYT